MNTGFNPDSYINGTHHKYTPNSNRSHHINFKSFTLLLFYSFSIEHRTLPLLAPRSTDWANWLLDTNAFQIKIFNAMNVRKLLKKRK